MFCPRAGPSLQAQEPRLQFCRRQVFHRTLRKQGCSFTRNWIGAVASHCFPHPTLSLASEQTLKDLKRSQGHQTWRWGEWIWLTGPSGLHRNSPYYWHFMNFIALPIYRLLTLLSATKERFKALWRWYFSPCFPSTSGVAPVTQPGTTRLQNGGPKYRNFSCIYDIPIVLPTPSLHIEMVKYWTSYTKNRTTKLHISILVLKYATKLIHFLSKGTKSKVVRWAVLT